MGAEQSTLSEPLSSQTRPQRAATRARTNTSFEPGEAQSGAGLETYASLTAFIVLHAIGEGGFGQGSNNEIILDGFQGSPLLGELVPRSAPEF